MNKKILIENIQSNKWYEELEQSNLMYNYLHFTSINMYQRKDMFRNNTDTAQLGRFLKVKEKESILDIGTNNGALLLYASLMHPKLCVGIDILEDACELARLNMELNHIDAKIECCDFRDFKGSFDVIVCNPPYFDYKDPRVKKENFRDVARHNMEFTMDELAYHTSRLLNENGRIYLVHRSDYVFQIASSFNKMHMEIKTIQYIYHSKEKGAHGVLLEIKKHSKPGCKVLKPILLNEEE